MDSIAILVTGGDIVQLLAVPKIGRGTVMEQCNACLSTLTDWEFKPFVQGLVFDTTASNTGLKIDACILLEKALWKELVWIARRHHVFEVILSAVFSAALGTASGVSGPEVPLFKRFRSQWGFINNVDFQPAAKSCFLTSQTVSDNR